jgi:hypothetical protein
MTEVNTAYVYPPVDSDGRVWIAYGENVLIIGWGTTEQEAIQDYLRQVKKEAA